MTTTARFAVDATMLYMARSAARWIPRFHPAVIASVEENSVALKSDSHTANALAAIWTSALLTEQASGQGRTHREWVWKQLGL